MEVNSSLKQLSGKDSVRLDVSFPASHLVEAINTIARKYAVDVRIPGFRQGKVPLGMIKERFKDTLRAEALEKTLPQAIEAAIKKEKIDIYGPPRLNEDEVSPFAMTEDVDPIKFSVTFALPPKATIKPATSVTLRDHQIKVSSEDVEASIEEELLPYAPLEEITGKVAYGDLIQADIVFAEERFADKTLRGHHFMYRDEQGGAEPDFLNDLRPLILEMKTGEKKTALVVFSDEKNNESVSRKPPDAASAEITIKGIKRRGKPNFDEALLTKLGVASEEVYRERVSTGLKQKASATVKRFHRQELFKELTKSGQFRIPAVAIDDYVERQWKETMKQMKVYLERQGLTGSKLEQSIPKEPNEPWVKETQERARLDLRQWLIFKELEKLYPAEASSADVEARLREFATQTGRENDLEGLRRDLVQSGDFSRLQEDCKQQAIWNRIVTACRHKKGRTYSLKDFLKLLDAE